MKKYFFYIVVFAAQIFALACQTASSSVKNGETTDNVSPNATEFDPTSYGKPRVVGTLKDDAIDESSGVAASRTNRGVFWTHNDSGDGAFLYAFSQTGKKLGVWKVEGAKNIDWEDIAAYTDKKSGENYLLIGDTGDNSLQRENITIYRLSEPNITEADAKSSKKSPLTTSKAEVLTLKYPEKKSDAETLLVNPANGDLYLLTKNMTEKSIVYKVSAPFDSGRNQSSMQKIAEIAVPSLMQGFVTGGDASGDGKRVVICDYFAAYEYVLPPKARDFDEIWKSTPSKIELGERKQGEAIAYTVDGKEIIVTSEKSKSPITMLSRK